MTMNRRATFNCGQDTVAMRGTIITWPWTSSWLGRVSSVGQPTQILCTILASYAGWPKRSATACLNAEDAIESG